MCVTGSGGSKAAGCARSATTASARPTHRRCPKPREASGRPRGSRAKARSRRRARHPFDTGGSPRSDGGNPGVNETANLTGRGVYVGSRSRSGKRSSPLRRPRSSSIPQPSGRCCPRTEPETAERAQGRLRYIYVYPFDTGCSPLSHSGNPGVNAYLTGRRACPPLQHWLFTPESQWQSRGKRRISHGACEYRRAVLCRRADARSKRNTAR